MWAAAHFSDISCSSQILMSYVGWLSWSRIVIGMRWEGKRGRQMSYIDAGFMWDIDYKYLINKCDALKHIVFIEIFWDSLIYEFSNCLLNSGDKILGFGLVLFQNGHFDVCHIVSILGGWTLWCLFWAWNQTCPLIVLHKIWPLCLCRILCALLAHDGLYLIREVAQEDICDLVYLLGACDSAVNVDAGAK